MKKHFISLLASASVLCLSLFAVSCEKTPGDQEDKGSTATVDVLYTLKGSEIASLEFTENSLYIIVRSENVKSPTRADSESNILTGTYTKSGNVYKLDGFGTVTIENDYNGDWIVSITIEETGKAAVTVNAAMNVPSDTPSSMTAKLCRAWKADKCTYTEYDFETDEVLENEELTYDSSSYVKFIFTQNGTIMIDADGEIYLDSWGWADESEGALWFGDQEEEMTISISFEGASAVLTCAFSGQFGIEVVDGISTPIYQKSVEKYYLTELK